MLDLPIKSAQRMNNQPPSGTLIEFGPFSFDRALGKLSKQGTPVRLRGMPLKILQHLVERPGEAVSRGELQSLLWNGTAFGDFEQGLNSAVNVVRRTLSDSADQPRYIETVPGKGYRFIAPIRSEAVIPETLLEGDSARARGQYYRWWIPAVLALAALGGGVWWTFQSRPRPFA